MLKTLILLFIIGAIFVLCMFIKTGLKEQPHVYIQNYVFSKDGKTLIFRTFNPIFKGYMREEASIHTRGFKDRHENGVHFLTFYSPYGGFSSEIEARSVFTLRLDDEDTAIYFNADNGGYRLVFEKNKETGNWEKKGIV